MKRALAERAKQSGHPNGLAPPVVVTSSSSPTQPPPHKIPRIDNRQEQTHVHSSSSCQQQVPPPSQLQQQQQQPQQPAHPAPIRIPSQPQLSSSTSTTSPTGRRPSVPKPAITKSSSSSSSSITLPRSPKPPKSSNNNNGGGSGNTTPRRSSSSSSLKRQRPGSSTATGGGDAADDDDDNDEHENKAFYLKHQNSALASELKALQHKLRQLEKERNVRRKQCHDANQALQQLEGLWTQMEVALQLGIQSKTDNEISVKDEIISSTSTQDNNTPMSTGTGDSVELIGALLDSLAELAKDNNNNIMDGVKNDDSSNTRTTKMEEGEDGDNNEDGEIENEINNNKSLAKTAVTVSRRAMVLQEWIWTLLQKIHKQSSTTMNSNNNEDAVKQEETATTSSSSSSPIPSIFDVASLRGKVSLLESQCRDCESRIGELSKARDEANNSDRRVRRGLYRIAAGRMKLDEVLNDLEDDKNTNPQDIAEAAAAAAAAAAHGGAYIDPAVVTDDIGIVKSTSDNRIKGEDNGDVDGTSKTTAEGMIDSTQLAALKKQIQDLEEISKSREKQIDDLIKEREHSIKRINSLTIPKPGDETSKPTVSDEDIKRSKLYADATIKLMSTERQLQDLQRRIKDIKNQWSTCKGDSELATKTLEELNIKHKKRWIELTTYNHQQQSHQQNNDEGEEKETIIVVDDDAKKKEEKEGDAAGNDHDDGEAEDGTSSSENIVGVGGSLEQAKQLVELEHKLKQALENVRQADTIRVSLAEAMKMNESLQMKLEEMKTKNSLLVAGKTASRASLDGGGGGGGCVSASATSSSSHTSSSNKEKPSSSSSSSASSVSIEKFRKVRKELAAAVASKEGAKAKQERAEKERDALVKTNTRLLKQSAEKDDTNAKSLSSILHLKHQTELLAQEKELLEQKAKSSGQLALAARLATNAKERVAEEAMKEKKAIEGKLAEVQEKCDSLLQAKELAEGQLAQAQTETTSLENNILKLRQRCDELAEESTKLEEEKRRLSDALSVAQREATESAKKYASVISRDRGGKGGHSEFTTEELTTQVSVLKGRLACPVCNHRDKKCILLRCRHMFCKQCVEENVRNRSRKCPACGQRFDNKDVADVWL